MIFLDTHVMVWLYARLFERLSPSAEKLINENDVYFSPMVKLELKYLFEIERITEQPDPILQSLENEMGLRVQDIDLANLVDQSLDLDWTRDPFDRLIVAQARIADSLLITKDTAILENFNLARW